MSIETEAIQVAAVAAAMVEERQSPALPGGTRGQRIRDRKWWDPTEMVLGMVRDQRRRQGEKWGSRRHTPMEWLMILAGEVGELATSVAELEGEGADPQSLTVKRLLESAGQEARKWITDHPWPGAGSAS